MEMFRHILMIFLMVRGQCLLWHPIIGNEVKEQLKILHCWFVTDWSLSRTVLQGRNRQNPFHGQASPVGVWSWMEWENQWENDFLTEWENQEGHFCMLAWIQYQFSCGNFAAMVLTPQVGQWRWVLGYLLLDFYFSNKLCGYIVW